MEKKKGKLYLVGTPIGNLKDITLRAIEVLQCVDVIASEDTRRTLQLLNHLGISKRVISYHQHNEKSRSNDIIRYIQNGLKVALVTDAGTPGISDPGEEVVKLAINNGIQVEGIPGPTASILALTISGLQSTPFLFVGFLPRDKKEKKRVITDIAQMPYTMVFYESPHRLLGTLNDLYQIIGDRNIAVCRELTKKYEEVFRGKVSEALNYYQDSIKGEFTLVLEGFKSEGTKIKEISEEELLYYYSEMVKQGYSNKDIARILSDRFNLSKNYIYDIIHKTE